MLSPVNQRINLLFSGIFLFICTGISLGSVYLLNDYLSQYSFFLNRTGTIDKGIQTPGFYKVSPESIADFEIFFIFLLILTGSLFLVYRKKRNQHRAGAIANNLPAKKQEGHYYTGHNDNESSYLNEFHLSSVFENLPGFVYRCKNDSNWTMLYISEGCKSITGYAAEDFLHNNKLSYSSIIKPKYRLHVEEVWNSALETKTSFAEEYEILTANNHTKWLRERGAGVFDKSGNLLFLEGYIEDISDRKFTQARLAENEEKFRKLFHNHSAVKLLIDPEDGSIVDANEAAARFYGWTIDELTHMTISAVNVIPSNEVKLKMAEAVFNKNINFEFCHRKANGEVVNVEVFASRIDIGNKVFLHSIIHDISEKQRAVNSLRESEEINRLIMDNSMDAIMLTKPDGSIISANKAACAMFGMTEDELTKAGREGVVDMEDPRLQALLKQREENHLAKGELTLIRKDGTKFPADISSSLFTNSNGEIFSSMVVRDITQGKLAEEEIRTSNEFNKTLMQTIPFAMNIVDEDGIILFQNKQHKEMYGGKAFKNRCFDLYRTDKTKCPACPLNAGLKTGKTKTIESDGIIGDRTFQITHTGMMFNGKKAMLEIFQDITDRKNWERALLEAKEKAEINDRLKTAFLANMSHEIRTPMNGIMGFISLIDNPEIGEQARQDYLQIIKQSGDRLLETINDIIEFSKIEAGEQEVNNSLLNLTEFMQFHLDIFTPQAIQQNIELGISEQITGEAALINTDKSKLDSILSNLIKNALKFTTHGQIVFGNYLKDNELTFYVKDTGLGIPPDKLEVIFERFVQADMSLTRAHEGSGLGLSIAKAYADVLGGSIGVESEVGIGSTFFLTLPYNSAIVQEIQAPVTVVVPPHATPIRPVLIAEDDEISYLFLEFILEQEGISVTRTVNGIDVVNHLKTNPDVALILMDLKMPEMDGLEATKEIRKFNQTIPIIAQTAYALPGDREKALQAGCNDYITKPVDKEKVLKVLNKFYY